MELLQFVLRNFLRRPPDNESFLFIWFGDHVEMHMWYNLKGGCEQLTEVFRVLIITYLVSNLAIVLG